MAKREKPTCEKCGTPLVCPGCAGVKGGKATAKKHGKEQMKEWGKLGGRPRKKPA